MEAYIFAPQMEPFYYYVLFPYVLVWGVAFGLSKLFNMTVGGIPHVGQSVNAACFVAVLLHLLVVIGIVWWFWWYRPPVGQSWSYSVLCIVSIFVDVYLLARLRQRKGDLERFAQIARRLPGSR